MAVIWVEESTREARGHPSKGHALHPSEVHDTYVPFPNNPTQCVPPKALSRIATCPIRPPTAVGVNVTSMVQLASGLRLLPQVLVCAAAHALASLSEDPGLLRARRARYQADVEAPSLAYSAFACLRTGMSGSASFQRAKKSW